MVFRLRQTEDVLYVERPAGSVFLLENSNLYFMSSLHELELVRWQAPKALVAQRVPTSLCNMGTMIGKP